MARIEPIEMDAATSWAKELLEELASRGGEPGPMVRAMANAPALLRGYADLNRAMKRSHAMSTRYLAWATAVGAAGCGRCATAA